ncbi:MAG: hypothetical protein AAF587_07350 [Bacteroidota bacterium]
MNLFISRLFSSTIVLSILLVLTDNALLGQDSSFYQAFEYRCVGPSRGGRVTAVAGIRSQPGTFYMGASGGGVWKSTDYGTSWHNVSDGYFGTPSIGAIRVVQHYPDIVYVGTGTDGLRSNIIQGDGMYKSSDGGSSWEHIGLEHSGHIGAVEIHPANPDIVFVAAIGNAFSPNEERGVFRTQDGGESWEKVLFLSDTTGFADLEIHPSNPDIIYAAAWRAERKPWTIISGGEEGGIYKSTDGGDSWNKLTEGLPDSLIGKIDLAVSPAQADWLYAVVEAPQKEAGFYLSKDGGDSFALVSTNIGLTNRPFYYTNIDADPQNPDVIYVMANGYFKSTNQGKSWKTLRPPHGDNHDMWINPDNPDLFIESNDGGANITHNGGKTWSSQLNQPTAELYQIEVDDQHPYWLYAGMQDNYTTLAVPSLPPYAHQAGPIGLVMNTGGCETGPAVPKPGNHNIVYANCKGRFSVYNKLTGQEQSYDVGARNMYGHNPKDLKFRFQRVSPIHVSPHDPNVIYHTSQYVHKTTDEGKSWEIISPDLTAFEADKQVISGTPLSRDITGEEFYSTIYAIRESPVKAGVIWVGANDGPVHVSLDGGKEWAEVTPPSLKKGGRIDCVEPSPHRASKAYFTSLRYQLGDTRPYIFRTTDNGKNWTLLTSGSNGIPADVPVRVVREDPNQEGLLYAGTEIGVFVSFDDGEQWEAFQQNLPLTPITDLKVHEEDLVLSTMGRSFWILDNISTLRQGVSEKKQESVVLYQPKPTYQYRYRGSRNLPANKSDIHYPPSAAIIDYYLSEDALDSIKLEVLNAEGKIVRTLFGVADSAKEQTKISTDMASNRVSVRLGQNLPATKGLHRFRWDMRHEGAWDKARSKRFRGGPRVSPGSYTLRLSVAGQTVAQQLSLLMDPKVENNTATLEDLKKQEALCLQVIHLLSEAKKYTNSVQIERKALERKEKKKALRKKEQERLAVLLNTESQLVTKKGRYEQPMLLSQIGYLFGIISAADQLPGKDAYERYEELVAWLAELR